MGQGLAGTLLALELMEADQSVFLINKESEDTASNKAAGLYNPITGRKMVKTWLADELFSDLEGHYERLEKKLKATFLFPKPIYRPFFSIEEQNDWQGKIGEPEYDAVVDKLHTKSLRIKGVIDPFGGLELKKCGSVDLPALTQAARVFFRAKDCYRIEMFDFSLLEENQGCVNYGNIEADKIIFCEGPDVLSNPYFKDYPFKLVKGEVLDVKTKLSQDWIVNRSVFMLPRNGVFKVGSTYDHAKLDHEPTPEAKKNICDRMEKIYEDDYKVVGHKAGVRPATYDRRPLVGLAGQYSRVGIFNGFGAKGVSLVPFFATQFVNYLLAKGDLHEGVSLTRLKN